MREEPAPGAASDTSHGSAQHLDNSATTAADPITMRHCVNSPAGGSRALLVSVVRELQEDQPLSLDVLTVRAVQRSSSWHQTVTVNGHPISFKLDTGSDVNLVSAEEWQKWRDPPPLSSPGAHVTTYTGEPLPLLGECFLQCSTPVASETLKFCIVGMPTAAILGLDACQRLIQRLDKLDCNRVGHIQEKNETPESIINEYKDVFEGIGRFPGEFTITLAENAQPVISAPRKIPSALEDKVKQELQRLEKEQVIVKVTEPTDWVSPVVVVRKKDGSLRICLDPRKLNEAIKRPHYQMPTFETLISRRHGSTVFTLLDAAQAFHHMRLDDASSRLCTFTTPYGRYRFLVMPFGLSCAPEMFQQAMDQVFASEEDIHPYFDDILITSNSLSEHCKQLRKVLEKARSANLKFNKDKLKLAVPKVNYLGHVLTAEGVNADAANTSTVL